eukprot:TRINITY_DN214_c0_g1_i1.p1 TRINITY_DN214_c0_g1~~TRINITY_DN214_c0_g1_i1.p1  ORF type:complete len:740 (-),score=187.89 TRINITY_DN214_c0_g1_i1:138-2357(-)
MSSKIILRPSGMPNNDSQLGLTNKIYLHPTEFGTLKAACGEEKLVWVTPGGGDKKLVFTFSEHVDVKPGTVGLNRLHRDDLGVGITSTDSVEISPFRPDASSYLSKVTLELDFLVKGTTESFEVKAEELSTQVINQFDRQVFNVGTKVVIKVGVKNLVFLVKECEVLDTTTKKDLPEVKKAERGIIRKGADIRWEKAQGSTLKLVGQGASSSNTLFKADFNFSNLGVGGLDNEFAEIFRKAFTSRIYPSDVIQKIGIKHVKGILLYGPPGTGKTLMARQIGKMLNAKEPKVVLGPEILNKFVGQSEENIRALFKDAEEEYKSKGEDSDLHMIIFDEIDAICKQRGMRNDSTGVGDTVVNQLLTKIDGPVQLNNILVIGMTNRKDLIDEALLRPGRLEIHMEISLPDEHGRVQILQIHTKSMKENGMMSEDVDLTEVAKRTKNFSGAELEGVVKSAAATALSRNVDLSNGVKIKEGGKITVNMSDFTRAVAEKKPAFGVDTNELGNCIRNGIVPYSLKVEKTLDHCNVLVQQVRNSSRTPLVSLLLEGPPGSGKTALAAKVASESGFPYVKMISAENLVGYSESGKCTKIAKVFEDAYRSPLSCIVVDDIERLLEYVRIGPRFSNAVLQALLVFTKKEPEGGRRLFIIGTTSSKRVLEDLELLDTFSSIQTVPQISSKQEFQNALKALDFFKDETELSKASSSFSGTLPIKKLIMYAEMASQGSEAGKSERLCSIIAEAN